MAGIETVKALLDPLGYDVRKWPGLTGQPTYIALTVLELTAPLRAGNRPLRRVAEVQVDIYSRLPIDALCDDVILALEGGGCPVVRTGQESRETDTGYNHMPIICQALHVQA